MATAAQNEPLTLQKEKVVLCEGMTDEALFNRILEINNFENIQVSECKGKDKIPVFIRSISKQIDIDHPLKALLVIRDSDTNPKNAFTDLQTALCDSGFSAPAEINRFEANIANPHLQIAVALMPHGLDEQGELEDLCVEAARTDTINHCIDNYFECVTDNGVVVDPTNHSKARMQVWAAARGEPATPLYEAINEGKFDRFLVHPAFRPLVELLRQMSEL